MFFGFPVFVLPLYSIFIYIAAAIVPALWLMHYIYQKDTVEKEPARLLWACVVRGILAALVSIVLETIGSYLLDTSRLDQNSVTYMIVFAFLVVAVIEEGTKYFFLYRRTWNDPDFNYRFDGIVYSAFVSLGFAAFENVMYVFNYGLSVAFTRAFLSIPAHLGFSVVFGYFYGRARLAADLGNHGSAAANIVVGYVLAVLLHGFYDSCALIGTTFSTVLFLVFVVVMYIVIIRLIKRESQTDEPV